MAFSTQGNLLEILMDQDNYQASLLELDRELIRRKCLGFGVDIEILVRGLVKQGYLDFDPKTEIVSLTQKYLDRIAQQTFNFY